MKKFIFIMLTLLLTSVSIAAQTNSKSAKKVFRANKDQIIMAQKMLKVPDTGKVDAETSAALKQFQTEKGIAATGTMNRATLEKLGIGLTAVQREIPAEPESLEPTKSEPSAKVKANQPIFRATKEQIAQAQKMLKENDFYAGAESGALDAATRAGLKKYQTANELTPTGTLDQATLEKMGIELTEKQKTSAPAESQ